MPVRPEGRAPSTGVAVKTVCRFVRAVQIKTPSSMSPDGVIFSLVSSDQSTFPEGKVALVADDDVITELDAEDLSRFLDLAGEAPVGFKWRHPPRGWSRHFGGS